MTKVTVIATVSGVESNSPSFTTSTNSYIVSEVTSGTLKVGVDNVASSSAKSPVHEYVSVSKFGS